MHTDPIVTPQAIAKDIIDYERTGRSAFYNVSGHFSVQGGHGNAPLWFRSRETHNRMCHAAYLFDAIMTLDPSFSKSLKKIEKAAKGLELSNLINPVARSVLYRSISLKPTEPSLHLKALWDFVKNEVNGAFIVGAEAPAIVKSLSNSGLSLEDLTQNIPFTSENLPGIAAGVLLFIDSEDRKDHVPAHKQTENRTALALKFFAPLYQEDLVRERKALLEALRLLCKRSDRAARYLATLHSVYVFKAKGADYRDPHKDADGLLQVLHTEGDRLEHIVQASLHEALSGIGRLQDLVLYERDLDSNICGIKNLLGKANRNDLDRAITNALHEFCNRSDRGGPYYKMAETEDPVLTRALWSVFYSRYATVAQDWQACVWSVLCSKRNVEDYRKTGRNKNSILRAALNAIEFEHLRSSLRYQLAEAAIDSNYDSKAIGLMLHGKNNREEIMKKIYHLVGDRKILEIMPGQTRKSTLMDELGL